MTYNGGPAFPRPVGHSQEGDRFEHFQQDGMTLADYFATAMMPYTLNEMGQLSTDTLGARGFSSYYRAAAFEAYEIAAAMLSQRGGRAELPEPEPEPLRPECPHPDYHVRGGLGKTWARFVCVQCGEEKPPADLWPMIEQAHQRLDEFKAHQQQRPNTWPCSCNGGPVCDDTCPHFAVPCIKQCDCGCDARSRLVCTHPRYRPVGDYDGMECICCGHLAIKAEIADRLLYCQDCDISVPESDWPEHQRRNPSHIVGRSL